VSTHSIVTVMRGGLAESSHRVSIAVVDGTGMLRAASGSPDLMVFARSAVKPLQALPLLDDGVVVRFGWGDAELALACGSHSGEPRHVELVRAMLHSIGLDENALACGPHTPFSESAARMLRDRGMRPTRLHNNCSGKHAGMLGLAATHGWRLSGYHERPHPVQQRLLDELARWSNVPREEIGIGVDGCGVATFALPLRALAAAFAALARDARMGRGAAARVLGAMSRFPELVGGSQRLCTDLMLATEGRVIGKVGAEGVYCAAVPGAELGVALKIEDGAKRAAEPALLGVLRLLGVLGEDELAALAGYARPVVYNTRQEVVGDLHAQVELEAGNG
jgi:L-asparaginase II